MRQKLFWRFGSLYWSRDSIVSVLCFKYFFIQTYFIYITKYKNFSFRIYTLSRARIVFNYLAPVKQAKVKYKWKIYRTYLQVS